MIQQRGARHFDITVDLLLSRTRRQAVANARHVAMYLTKRLTSHSLKVIGLHFGNRDHSTVVHAIQAVEAKCASNSAFARTVETLQSELSPANKPS